MNLDVQVLPEKPDDPVFVKSLNSKPGILALAMNEIDDGKGGKTLKGIPFIVPGARFNEVRSLLIHSHCLCSSESDYSYTTGTLISMPLDFSSMVKSAWRRAWSTTSSSKSNTTARSRTVAEATISAESNPRS